jgi:predicted XRE-type DNA-binding protein
MVRLDDRQYLVHRLLAKSFIPNPENKPNINHKDGDPSNLTLENLEWCTQQENVEHSFKTGLQVNPKGEEAGNAKLTEEDVVRIKRLLETNLYQWQIAEEFNVHKSTISLIKSKKVWSHV